MWGEPSKDACPVASTCLAARLLQELLHLLLRLAGKLCEARSHPRRVLHELLATPLHALQHKRGYAGQCWM